MKRRPTRASGSYRSHLQAAHRKHNNLAKQRAKTAAQQERPSFVQQLRNLWATIDRIRNPGKWTITVNGRVPWEWKWKKFRDWMEFNEAIEDAIESGMIPPGAQIRVTKDRS